MNIIRLDHLVLTVTDILQTCNFYGELLGIEIITFSDNRKALKVGNQKINLHQSGEELSPCARRPVPGSADLCFIVEQNIDDVRETLLSRGVEIELGPVERTGVAGRMTSLYFRDPDGNLIEISQYF
ncbi:VOC family protein [Desulfomarina sp.]